MSSFQAVPLMDICRPKQWKVIPASKQLESGYPLYGANGKIGFYSEYTHKNPTLMITCRGATCGNVHISEPKSYINGNAMALDNLNDDLVDINYLYRFFQSRGFDDVISGSAQPQITRTGLEKITVPLPPLNEQKHIAAILDKAGAIRRKRRQAIELTDQLLRSVFLDMFGDPVTNPKGWPIEDLGDHLSFVTSGSRGWAKYYSNSGTLFIRSLDVQMNELVFKDAAFVMPPDNAEAKRTMVYKGDVLLTITGSRIGRVSPVRDDLGRAHISQHVAIIRPNDSLVAEYISMFLSDINGGQKQIKESSYGQTKPGLNLEQIKSFQIPVPSIDAQEKYLKIAHRLRDVGSKLDKIAEESSVLFQSLSVKVFQGELSKQTKAA